MKKIILGFTILLALTGCAAHEKKVELGETAIEQKSAREIMQDATVKLDELVAIEGFKYASKESFAAMVAYLDLQNAFIAADQLEMVQKFDRVTKRVDVAYKQTAEGKRKHLENLGYENTTGLDQLREFGQPIEVYKNIYIVKKGDTLPAIAARHEIYNDSFMWPLIYKANRDQIKDPRSIYAGQDLKIAREITIEEIVEARREAGAPEPENIPKDAYVPKAKQ